MISCSNTKNDEIVGEWFYSEDNSISIRSDKTWKADDAYGSGTWKYLDDETIELTDFYGSTKEICIEEDEYGIYITYHKKSYKDEYPITEKSDQSNTANNNSNNNDQSENNSNNNNETSATKAKINPFDGIQYMVTGISPYCTVTANNANCSENAQMYVEYSFDKEYYQNGDVATVTASFINTNDSKKYELTSSTHTYTVENQAEYITVLNEADLAMIQTELQDYIVAKEGSARWWSTGHQIMFMDIIFGCFDYNEQSFEESDFGKFELDLQNAVYFSCLKLHAREDQSKDFNICSFICNVKFRGESTPYYICIMAENIVKNTDGSITWGSEKNTSGFDFTTSNTEGDLDNALSILIMSNSIEYNIFNIKN